MKNHAEQWCEHYVYEERSCSHVQNHGSRKAPQNQEPKRIHSYEVPEVHIIEEICGVNGVGDQSFVLECSNLHTHTRILMTQMCPGIPSRLPWECDKEEE